ncbi:Dephospho-CoA kinase [Fimbriimonas ginsengisoli Gsoil 348]|uniref:Dephospho-CoA kinase n=1 Tax=Fimbriimonas ginsengisoli Gsoil 348 TaxID=661478 RepID=A0A068NME9_FIMGI|nr:Dephospho-CoA kinase [Fimbriimonas ginsengisoli Gsoil 348]
MLQMLEEIGYSTLSADAVARQIAARGDVAQTLARIAGLEHPFAPAELRAALAGSEEIRRQVNATMHPLVMEEIDRHPATFVEVPLLIEACLQSTFDRIWVVTCGPREQKRRLMQRYGDKRHVEGILSTQLSSRAKIPFADVVLRTNRPLDHVRRLLSEAASELAVR